MIPNPWVLLGIGLTWIASCVAVGFWQNTAGHVAERVTWQAKENADLKAANKKIGDLEEANRALEQKHQTEVQAIGAQYETQRQAADDQRRRDVDAARAGAIRLRVAGACPATRGSVPAEAAPAPAGGDGRTTGELPGPVAAALLGLADDADAIVNQLTSCQATVKSYLNTERKTP